MDKAHIIKLLRESVTKRDLVFSEFSDSEKKYVVQFIDRIGEYQRNNKSDVKSAALFSLLYKKLPDNLKEFISPSKNKLRKLYNSMAIYGVEDIKNDPYSVAVFTNNKEESDMFGTLSINGMDVKSYDGGVDLKKLNAFISLMLRGGDKIRKYGTTRTARNYDMMHDFIEDTNLNYNIDISDDENAVILINPKYDKSFPNSIKPKKRLSENMDEVIKTKHYKERYVDRISGKDTTFSKEKPQIYDKVVRDLKYLESINFPPEWVVGILVYFSNVKYKMKSQSNLGTHLWGVVRYRNELDSIGWYSYNQTPDAVRPKVHKKELLVSLDKLKDYVENVNGGNKNLSDEDLFKIKKEVRVSAHAEKELKKSQEKPKEKTGEAYIRIDGVGWILDANNGVAYKKNKPEKKEPLEPFIEANWDKIPEKYLELILSLL